MALNPKHTKKLRQHLRNNMTEAEIRLWSRLKSKQISGYKVRRQYGVGPYIVDFYCLRLKLAIEIDGDSHFSPSGQSHDKKRDDYIRKEGIEILRLTTTEVYENLDGVVDYLTEEFQKRENCW
jgi:very-short-patch-repair endonuclease